MKAYTGVAANGETVRYVDKKRWLWTLSVVYPLQPLIVIGLHARTGVEAWFLLPFFFNYVIAPLLDWLIGADSNNPPEEVVMQLDRDVYYRRLTYAVVPLHFISLLASVWYAATQPLSWWAFFLIAAFAGLIGGLAINSAITEPAAAKGTLAMTWAAARHDPRHLKSSKKTPATANEPNTKSR